MAFSAAITVSERRDDAKLTPPIENTPAPQRIISMAVVCPCIYAPILQFDGMSDDDLLEFKPRSGKPRGQSRARPRAFVAEVLRAVAEQGGDPRRVGRSGKRKPSGRFNARGRGREAAASLKGHGGWESASGEPWTGGMRYRARRVVVKARVVKLKGVQSQAIAAHLRYLQRDGVTTDGQHGQAYSGEDDRADTRTFADRGLEDRHQFRFIVAAEDGVELGDLKSFTRDLMRQMEQDLDTTLDWVAVDHFNTGQPHTHVVVRGVTDEGKILYIAGDYIAHGIRARASDLVTRQLGRQTELEVQQKLSREVDHDRFTRLDRTLLNEVDDGRVDLRISPGQSYLVRANRHLLIARLQKLEAMELAEPVEPGVWELSPKLEPSLKQLGQRIDTINIMHRALGEEAAERRVSQFTIYREVPRSPVTGHLRGKGLAGDGLTDKAYLVIDGIDGRVHYLEADAGLLPEEARLGAILTVGREPSVRSADKTIAALAARNHGFYEPRRHAEIARVTLRIPSGEVDGHVEAHVRRLEALRRAGIIERLDADHWEIPKDFLEQAVAYDKQHARKLVIDIHSAVNLDRQVTADAATWLDRQLVGRHPVERAPIGFGRQVEKALERRNETLIDRKLAYRAQDGAMRYQPDLLATLQRRELDRAGERLAARNVERLSYVPARDGATIRGIYRGTISLTSGRFAIIANEQQFTLTPWRPVLERFRGREVVGIARGLGISWQLGLHRTRGLSRSL
jgi:type IV secretory pathway VirD2 relaxase